MMDHNMDSHGFSGVSNEGIEQTVEENEIEPPKRKKYYVDISASNIPYRFTRKLNRLWERIYDEIENHQPEHPKRDLPVPAARIRKIMRLEEKFNKASPEVVVLVSKAIEMLVTDLTLRAWVETQSEDRRKLTIGDVARAARKNELFDFLIDIVPKVKQEFVIESEKEDPVPVKPSVLNVAYPPPIKTMIESAGIGTGTKENERQLEMMPMLSFLSRSRAKVVPPSNVPPSQPQEEEKKKEETATKDREVIVISTPSPPAPQPPPPPPQREFALPAQVGKSMGLKEKSDFQETVLFTPRPPFQGKSKMDKNRNVDRQNGLFSDEDIVVEPVTSPPNSRSPIKDLQKVGKSITNSRLTFEDVE